MCVTYGYMHGFGLLQIFNRFIHNLRILGDVYGQSVYIERDLVIIVENAKHLTSVMYGNCCFTPITHCINEMRKPLLYFLHKNMQSSLEFRLIWKI